MKISSSGLIRIHATLIQTDTCVNTHTRDLAFAVVTYMIFFKNVNKLPTTKNQKSLLKHPSRFGTASLRKVNGLMTTLIGHNRVHPLQNAPDHRGTKISPV